MSQPPEWRDVPTVATPPPPPPPQRPAGPGGGPFGLSRRGLLILVGALAGVVIGVLVFVAFVPRPVGSAQQAGRGEIFLQPAGDGGPNPFTASVAAATLPAPTPTASAAAPSGSGSVAVQTTIGSTPGLYGGTNRLGSCDAGQMVSYLNANPAKGAAWVQALNADPSLLWSAGNKVRVDQIAAYISELTSVVLTADTRVTNHGFLSGQPTPFQSVLQAGTAVLVDRYGVPRARCACGNPLIAAVPVSVTPTYRGAPWTGFSPTTVVVVQPTTVIIDTFTLVDVNTGGRFKRPVGSKGDQDGNVTPTGEETPAPSAAASPPPDQSALAPPPAPVPVIQPPAAPPPAAQPAPAPPTAAPPAPAPPPVPNVAPPPPPPPPAQPPPAPQPAPFTLQTISPSSGPIAGGTHVVITGSGFTGQPPITDVYFSAGSGQCASMSFSVVSDTRMTGVTSSGAGCGSGTPVYVVVVCQGQVSSAFIYTFN
jgi:hypothetical protein